MGDAPTDPNSHPAAGLGYNKSRPYWAPHLLPLLSAYICVNLRFVIFLRVYSRQFAVGIFAVLLVKPSPPKRADAPKTIKVTINTAPVTICCSSGVTPASPNTF
jgi:hypothetical protein